MAGKSYRGRGDEEAGLLGKRRVRGGDEWNEVPLKGPSPLVTCCLCLLTIPVCLAVLAALVVAAYRIQLHFPPSATNPSVPWYWSGPLPTTPQIWGGPSLPWSQQEFQTKTIPSDGVENFMPYARAGSPIPEGLQGVFWLDQYGVSSIAKAPGYGFAMSGVPEILVTWNTSGSDGTAYQPDTRCVTPIPFYGGQHLAVLNNGYGQGTFGFHLQCKTTLSFCFTDNTFQTIKIYQKMLTETTSLGPYGIGAFGAFLLGYPNAGSGYSWTSDRALSMGMVKTPYGWDRVTTVLNLLGLPSWVPLLGGIHAKYPVLQIVDGNGQRTQYYAEYLAAMAAVPNGAGLNLKVNVAAGGI